VKEIATRIYERIAKMHEEGKLKGELGQLVKAAYEGGNLVFDLLYCAILRRSVIFQRSTAGREIKEKDWALAITEFCQMLEEK